MHLTKEQLIECLKREIKRQYDEQPRNDLGWYEFDGVQANIDGWVNLEQFADAISDAESENTGI